MNTKTTHLINVLNDLLSGKRLSSINNKVVDRNKYLNKLELTLYSTKLCLFIARILINKVGG